MEQPQLLFWVSFYSSYNFFFDHSNDIFLFFFFFCFFIHFLAGEMLAAAEPWVAKIMHPSIIISAYNRALTDATEHLSNIAVPLESDEQLLNIVKSSVGTKFISRYGDHLCQLAIDAVKTVNRSERKEIDIKRYVRIEKVRGSF